MADSTIQGLPSGTALTVNDLLIIDQYITGLYHSRKLTGLQLADFVRAQQYYRLVHDNASTAMTQRSVLRFDSNFNPADDSSDGVTVINLNLTAVWTSINSHFVDKEVPAGAKDDVNVTFTLANTPVAGSDHVYLNGMLLQAGAGGDYTISGATITMNIAPSSTDKLVVTYRK